MENTYNTLNCGDLACEVLGIESTIALLGIAVKPNENAFAGGSVPTQETIENAFYAVRKSLQRIADALNQLEAVQMK